jgi:hypothetical protein
MPYCIYSHSIITESSQKVMELSDKSFVKKHFFLYNGDEWFIPFTPHTTLRLDDVRAVSYYIILFFLSIYLS